MKGNIEFSAEKGSVLDANNGKIEHFLTLKFSSHNKPNFLERKKSRIFILLGIHRQTRTARKSYLINSRSKGGNVNVLVADSTRNVF